MLDILFMDMSDKISSLQNFIEYLTSNETIHYSHLWNLCTSPNDWLFKNGINLMLVQPDKTNDVKITCPPYFVDSYKDIQNVLAIKCDSNDGNLFEPVYHLTFKSKKITKSVSLNKKIAKKLYEMTRKCSVTPNYSLLPGIFKMKGMVPTPTQFPLHEAKLVVSMLKEYGYEVHEYVRDFYNKIIGLSVYDTKAKKKMDGSHVLFFTSLPSSIDSSYSVNTISNIKFTNFTIPITIWLYEDVLVTDPVRYRMNTLPTEVIIDGGKITALVTNSQSIIPVEPTDFDTSRIVDGD